MPTTTLTLTLMTLIIMSITLNIDNIIFISIIASNLPPQQSKIIKITGFSLMLITRIVMITSINVITTMDSTLFSTGPINFSIKKILLISGGLFLVIKATKEIHHEIYNFNKQKKSKVKNYNMITTILHIIITDVVFSFDSTLTLIALSHNLKLIIASEVITIIFIIITSNKISSLLSSYPTIKIMTISFIITIGLTLISEALDHHIPKHYLHITFLFSIFVEIIHIAIDKYKKSN